MTFNLPPKVRFGIYVVFGVGSLVVTYLVNKGRIGVDEVQLFTGLSAFAYGLAAINVNGVTK
jgi:hypothetical protein